MTASELTKFWRRCQLEKPPYVHPCDEQTIRSVQSCSGGYDKYVEAFEKSKLSKTAFHLGLLPQPYHGDLENAQVIILWRNPGFHPSDYVAEEKYPEFRQLIKDTIRQRVRSHMFLNPKWIWTGGFDWWESKLRKVAQQLVAHNKFEDCPSALADLAANVASVELIPYHSVSFGKSRKYRNLTQMPSANAAREFAKEASKDRKVIVPRAVKDWDIGSGKNIISYDPNQALSAPLGPTSLGGQAILELYGLS